MESRAELQAHLATANGFTEAETDANRQGSIAGTQIPRLIVEVLNGWTVLALALLPVWLLVTLHLFGIRFPVGGWDDPFSKLLLGALWAVVAVFLAWQFQAVNRLFLLAADLAVRRARSVEGRLSTSVSSETYEEPVEEDYRSENPWDRVYRQVTVEHYWYVIADERVEVPRRAFEVLQPYSGSTCRVYVTARSGLLLSLEILQVRLSPLERIGRR